MSDEQVDVPFGENAGDQAVLLLAAAQELDMDPSVVRTETGKFVVPKEVADKATISDDPKKAAKAADKAREDVVTTPSGNAQDAQSRASMKAQAESDVEVAEPVQTPEAEVNEAAKKTAKKSAAKK